MKKATAQHNTEAMYDMALESLNQGYDLWVPYDGKQYRVAQFIRCTEVLKITVRLEGYSVLVHVDPFDIYIKPKIRLKIKENADVEVFRASGSQQTFWTPSKALREYTNVLRPNQGKWIDVSTEHLFEDQFNGIKHGYVQGDDKYNVPYIHIDLDIVDEVQFIHGDFEDFQEGVRARYAMDWPGREAFPKYVMRKWKRVLVTQIDHNGRKTQIDWGD